MEVQEVSSQRTASNNCALHHQSISIFEASNRLGGKLLTEQFSIKDFQYEAGAAEFYDYSLIDEDPLRELIEHFGLPIQPMGGASVVQDKKDHRHA